MTTTSTAPRTRRVFYPDSDGKPMAETDVHADVMTDSKEALRGFFAKRPDVYVSGNNFVYFEEGSPRARVSPDVYVVFGAAMRQRNSYKCWEEDGRLPSVVIEITSRKTKNEDIVTKYALYQRLGIHEYFLFDPTGTHLKDQRLRGYRLDEAGKYQPIAHTEERLFSEELYLELFGEGTRLRFYDPTNFTLLPTPSELRRQAAREKQRADSAEARVTELLAELERLKENS
nr:Uma2 family endonuclease [Armatimonas sp.]